MNTGSAEEITVTFDPDTIDRLDEFAAREYQGSRGRAVRTLLDRWLDERDSPNL